MNLFIVGVFLYMYKSKYEIYRVETCGRRIKCLDSE